MAPIFCGLRVQALLQKMRRENFELSERARELQGLVAVPDNELLCIGPESACEERPLWRLTTFRPAGRLYFLIYCIFLLSPDLF